MRCRACDAPINTVKEDLCLTCRTIVRKAVLNQDIESEHTAKEAWYRDLEIETGISIPKEKSDD